MRRYSAQRDRVRRRRIELYNEHIRQREPNTREVALRRTTHKLQQRARRQRYERRVRRKRRDRLEQVTERLIIAGLS